VGDGAFEAFVADTSTPLLRTAYLLTGDRRAADELLDRALISARRNWDRLAGPAEATAFARRALVTAHGGWRHRLDIGDVVADVPGFAGLTAPRPDPGPRPPVVDALARLSPRTRAVLVLRYGDGLSVAATAEAVGAGEDVVRQDTVHGLDRVADAVGGPGTDVGGRLRAALAARAVEVVAPDDGPERVLDGLVTQRRNRVGLLAVAVFLALVTLLVVLMIVTGAGR
jgi:DNA-directed RNA polymerase specialized sigma24 family protein